MEKKYILALDQGTTSSRALVIDGKCRVVASAQRDFQQIFPRPGWVEHDPNEIWSSQSGVAAEAIAKANLTGLDIAAMGIANQRETTIVWDAATSEPVYNAIVWQDRRTAAYCEELKKKKLAEKIRKRTGLVLDAYFSATKAKWILDNVPGARERAERGELRFGTVDTWLVWKLTRGHTHVTDVSNASRTMMFNIHKLEWDRDLLELFDIPVSMLPEVRQSSEVYCQTATTLFASKIPISGIAGDQQAALFGQLCTREGMAKTTYGTGCFVMMNTGSRPVRSKNNMLSTVAWRIRGETTYALEGSVFAGGAVVQWLRDGLGVVHSAREAEKLALSVKDNGGIYFVPAFTGLGAPYWDQYARGLIIGITRGTTAAHIARAALESIAFQVCEVVAAMRKDTSGTDVEIRVDGGAAENDFLMQFQADICRTAIVRPKNMESTAMGVAYLAGLAVGFWSGTDEIASHAAGGRTFEPEMGENDAAVAIRQWHRAVGRSLGWAEEDER